jgi:hypothetical protein
LGSAWGIRKKIGKKNWPKLGGRKKFVFIRLNPNFEKMFGHGSAG